MAKLKGAAKTAVRNKLRGQVLNNVVANQKARGVVDGTTRKRKGGKAGKASISSFGFTPAQLQKFADRAIQKNPNSALTGVPKNKLKGALSKASGRSGG